MLSNGICFLCRNPITPCITPNNQPDIVSFFSSNVTYIRVQQRTNLMEKDTFHIRTISADCYMVISISPNTHWLDSNGSRKPKINMYNNNPSRMLYICLGNLPPWLFVRKYVQEGQPKNVFFLSWFKIKKIDSALSSPSWNSHVDFGIQYQCPPPGALGINSRKSSVHGTPPC